MRLTDAKPAKVYPIGDGWCFSFGKDAIGHEIGVVYLLQREPHYTRFKIVEQDGLPAYQPISTRPLTAEEIAHFTRWRRIAEVVVIQL